jgi:hypothetical protein
MADKWSKADCLRDVFELLAREIPLVDRPNRPPTRFSERSPSAIREKLPEVRALVVHRSILRMIEEMISEDFPRLKENSPSSVRASSAAGMLASSTQRQEAHTLPTRAYENTLHNSTFEMPFSTQQIYNFSSTGVEDHEVNADGLLSFPGMFEFDAWG